MSQPDFPDHSHTDADRIGDKAVALGNAALMQLVGAGAAMVANDVTAFRAAGETVMFLAVDGHFAGFIGVADPVKPTTRQAISELKASGLHIVVVTGDNAATAAAVARQVGIEDVKAEVLPEDKYAQVQALQRARHIVAMAGDGVNDVLVAIVKKRLDISASLYEMLQILSLTMFEKTSLNTLLRTVGAAQNDDDFANQLNLFN